MNITEIHIRRAEPTDAEAFARMFEMPRVVWGTLQLPYPSVEQWRKRLAEPPDGLYGLVACVDASSRTVPNESRLRDDASVENQVVGSVGLHTFPHNTRRKHVAQLGMMVRDDWQGKGVGAALMRAAVELADKWLNVTHIELEVYADNEPALRLYKKFGFEIEGTLKQHAFRDGVYVDSYFMARLRPQLEIRNWKLEVGRWKLEVGGWKLEVGGWT
ncbi:MAG: GNAT family N-acetyltransferase [Chloroflexi bacterium]|nr:GNAT family N-acetyltransferase [Chloroflexota bacterium]